MISGLVPSGMGRGVSRLFEIVIEGGSHVYGCISPKKREAEEADKVSIEPCVTPRQLGPFKSTDLTSPITLE